MFEEIQRAVIPVMTRIFETMFFTFLELEERENNRPYLFSGESMPFLKGRIGFKGTYSGCLTFFLPLRLAKTMASNFMGLGSEEVSDFQAMDTVNELCNMVCGNLVTQLDKKLIWDLDIPKTHQISYKEMEREIKTSGININFDVEGYPMRLNIQIDSIGTKSLK